MTHLGRVYQLFHTDVFIVGKPFEYKEKDNEDRVSPVKA